MGFGIHEKNTIECSTCHKRIKLVEINSGTGIVKHFSKKEEDQCLAINMTKNVTKAANCVIQPKPESRST